jgi:hypothetical protein
VFFTGGTPPDWKLNILPAEGPELKSPPVFGALESAVLFLEKRLVLLENKEGAPLANNDFPGTNVDGVDPNMPVPFLTGVLENKFENKLFYGFCGCFNAGLGYY